MKSRIEAPSSSDRNARRVHIRSATGNQMSHEQDDGILRLDNPTAEVNMSGTFQCESCARKFKRLEHLKRHQWCHIEEKRFKCLTCKKCFTRSDILARHEIIHSETYKANSVDRQQAPLQASQGNIRTLKKRQRACTECAKGKERCTKTRPCRRCAAKSLQCIYPHGLDHAEAKVPYNTEPTEYNTIISGGGDRRREGSSAVPSEGPEALETFQYFSGQQQDELAANIASGQSSRPRVDFDIAPNRYSIGGSVEQLPQPPQIDGTVSSRTNGLFDATAALSSFDATTDLPVNWLPYGESFDLTYESIFGTNNLPQHFQNTNAGVLQINDMNPHDNSLEATTSGVPWTPSSNSRLALFPNSSVLVQQTLSPNSSIPSPMRSLLASSPPASTTSLPTGSYATSSDGSRMSCAERSRNRLKYITISNSTPLPRFASDNNRRPERPHNLNAPTYGFPDLTALSFDSRLYSCSGSLELGMTTYNKIKMEFQAQCLNPRESTVAAFSSDCFPSMENMNAFIILFFRNMSPILPIIHEPTFSSDDDWLLTLAIAAVGCQYTQTKEFSACVKPFQEFLGRALALEMAKPELITDHRVIKALILHQIVRLYYGQDWSNSLSRRNHAYLVDLVKFGELLQNSSHKSSLTLESERCETSRSSKRAEWMHEETKRRIGYSIWWLDTLMMIHFGLEPMLSLEVAQAQLPHDNLWISTLEETEWCILEYHTAENPSLFDAVDQIFRSKQVKADLGEFSRIILLHGLYQEMFLVRKYLRRPLASWTPSAQSPRPEPSSSASLSKRHDTNSGLFRAPSDNEKWIARNANMEQVLSWRNAALDCADTLHWAANAVIGLSSGDEHPTVMHLHLSRTILLTPYEKIITIALSIAPESRLKGNMRPIPNVESALEAERDVAEWAQRDESKARLAALHSGTLFWHARRYSTMAFYEPVSVFLATLTLWAYSQYTSKASNAFQPHQTSKSKQNLPNIEAHSDGQIDSPPADVDGEVGSPDSYGNHTRSKSPAMSDAGMDISFIHLDRPCDDEMVQYFVRAGKPTRITAYITGVGDICAVDAPIKILQEGQKILGRVSSAWGRTSDYVEMLEALETCS